MAYERSDRPKFCVRLRAGERLIGTFVKTAHHNVVEVLARTPLDFIVLDAEHAPFGKRELDSCLLAARLSGLPALVRLASARPDDVLSALDMGAAGVMAPHVTDVAKARDVVDSARYDRRRGFSNSHRAGDYGRPDLARYRREADEEAVVIVQIEDREALGDLDAILKVDGVDCAFIGRADLMASFGADSLDDERVAEAADRVVRLSREHGRRAGIYLGSTSAMDEYAHAGVSVFVIGSDQSLLKQAARALNRNREQELENG